MLESAILEEGVANATFRVHASLLEALALGVAGALLLGEGADDCALQVGALAGADDLEFVPIDCKQQARSRRGRR